MEVRGKGYEARTTFSACVVPYLGQIPPHANLHEHFDKPDGMMRWCGVSGQVQESVPLGGPRTPPAKVNNPFSCRTPPPALELSSLPFCPSSPGIQESEKKGLERTALRVSLGDDITPGPTVPGMKALRWHQL